MSQPVLLSPNEASDALARLCASASSVGSLEISVQEDRLFGDEGREAKWLSLGQIHPRIIALDGKNLDWKVIRAAMRRGSYEWHVPSFSDIQNDLIRCVQTKQTPASNEDKNSKKTKSEEPPRLYDQARRTSESVMHIILRAGLEHPRLDPDDFALLPFRRPVTLVADTNAVMQGGLDFAARFLYPMARLRVPGAVHLELNGMAHRYLGSRREPGDSTKRIVALRERLGSQGGLRTLLRLELQAGVEIERLREDSESNDDSRIEAKRGTEQATVPDRVILESAMRHRNRVSFGHHVRIMTSDQAPAKSALIEGIAPLYFPPRNWNELGGRRYHGVLFRPFRSSGTSAYHRVGLMDILWELATGFGAVRLEKVGGWTFAIRSVGQQLPWSVYQARHELLWVEQQAALGELPQRNSVPDDDPPDDSSATPSRSDNSIQAEVPAPSAAEVTVSHRPISTAFNLETLLGLLFRLHQHRSEPIDRLALRLNLSPKTISDYGFLLETGEFAKRENGKINVRDDAFDSLWTALQNRDWPTLDVVCLKLPGYKSFREQIVPLKPTQPEEITALKLKVVPAYLSLAGACGAALKIPGEGIYACGSPADGLTGFADAAIKSYKSVCDDSGLAQTGAWLEELARHHAIHPLFVPQLFRDATDQGLFKATLEGAVPDVRHPEHAFARINVGGGGKLTLETIQLYKGDYLAPHRSSVDLRIDV